MLDQMFGKSEQVKKHLENGIQLEAGNFLTFDNSAAEYAPLSIEIQYCPFCGRKLWERKWLTILGIPVRMAYRQNLSTYFFMSNGEFQITSPMARFSTASSIKQRGLGKVGNRLMWIIGCRFRKYQKSKKERWKKNMERFLRLVLKGNGDEH